MRKLAQFRNLLIPAAVGLTLAIAAGWYYFGWLPSQQRYLDERNFRLLTTLSGQIGTAVNTFDKMMDNAWDARFDEEHLYQVVHSLERVKKEDIDPDEIRDQYHDPPRIMVRADEGTHYLYFAYKRGDRRQSKKYTLRTDLEKLILGFLPPSGRNPFDVILVAQSDGTVFFQKSAPGISLIKIDELTDQSQVTKSGQTKQINLKSLEQSSNLIQVTVANTPYRLYSEPLPLSLPPFTKKAKNADDAVENPLENNWVLLGLVRADKFRAESMAFPYSYRLGVSFVLLLTLCALPFPKVFLSAPGERLRARDVTAIAVSSCIAMAAVSFGLLDIYHWRRGFEARDEEQMKDLAAAIDKSLGKEQETAYSLLDSLSQGKLFAEALHKARVSPDAPRPTDCDQKSVCRENILADKKTLHLDKYEYLQIVSWSDKKGQQLVKWTVKDHVTPFIKLDDPSISYYRDVRRAFDDPLSGGPNRAPTQGIGPTYSPTTGENITVFWKIEEINEKPTSDGKNKESYCASLVTYPISVIQPILPADFQFAIIRQDGIVVYHSDRTRNLHENFFSEVDQNRELLSRVALESEGSLLGTYTGRGYRLHVHPMKTNAREHWAVIVMRDMRVEETANLEALSLATILFVLYAFIMTLALFLVHGKQKSRGTRNWLWPDSRRASRYRQLVLVNTVAILVLLLVPQLPIRLLILLLAFLVPVTALGYNVAVLKRDTDSLRSLERDKESTNLRWKASYAASFATLLAVVAAVPCLSFFKVAWEFEQKLLIERSQRHLMDDVNERTEFVRSNYRRVTGEIPPKLLESSPVDQNLPTFFYADKFLKSEICSDTKPDGDKAEKCAGGAVQNEDLSLDLLLGSISPVFNPIASESHFLVRAAKRNPPWSLHRSNHGQQEYLQLDGEEPGDAEVISLWTPTQTPPDDWRWWLGASIFGAVLYGLVSFTLRRIFLLRFGGSVEEQKFNPPKKPKALPRNLLVVGYSLAPAIVSLQRRHDVQARDLYQMLSAPVQKAAVVGWSWPGARAPKDPAGDAVTQIVEDGRPIVFHNFERGLENPAASQKMLSALEAVLSRSHGPVVITSRFDPESKAPEEARKHWQELLQSFVRRDLSSYRSWQPAEPPTRLEDMISEEALHDSFFYERPRAQRLVLLQLAQEGLINPNSSAVADELVKEGLVKRSYGMLEIGSAGFAKFLNSAIPRERIKRWESQAMGPHTAAVRTSLLIAGVAVAFFLLYTQGGLVETWTKYMSAVGAALVALFNVVKLVRGGLAGAQPS
jgi:hypothetical protein